MSSGTISFGQRELFRTGLTDRWAAAELPHAGRSPRSVHTRQAAASRSSFVTAGLGSPSRLRERHRVAAGADGPVDAARRRRARQVERVVAVGRLDLRHYGAARGRFVEGGTHVGGTDDLELLASRPFWSVDVRAECGVDFGGFGAIDDVDALVARPQAGAPRTVRSPPSRSCHATRGASGAGRRRTGRAAFYPVIALTPTGLPDPGA